jgi:hypothetical protein
MQKPIRPEYSADPKLIAQFDRAQIDPRILAEIARLERARAIGEALACAIVWLIGLPRRMLDRRGRNAPTGRHVGSAPG